MKTHDIGPLFVAISKLVTLDGEKPPLIGALPSHETEPPYRSGLGFYFRLPLTSFAGHLGLWMREEDDPEVALMDAIAGYGIDLDSEVSEDDKRTVRQLVAEHTDDWDEEWEIINMLALEE